MNNLEYKMVDVLKDLKDNYGVSGVKAEFEAEGTRLEEALRLKEVVMRSNVNLTIKIGGCEAIRDMYECQNLGVQRIIAPMIESPYALKKFMLATQTVFKEDERKNINFGINIETVCGINLIDDILVIPERYNLSEIVIGRVDLTGSLEMKKDSINDDIIFNITESVFKKAKCFGLGTAIGGGVSAYSLPFFSKLGNLIDRYETRKVIFDCPNGINNNAETGILKAVGFEILWLKNKKEHYNLISKEDDFRLLM